MFICCSVSVPQLISRRRRVWRSSGGTFWTWLSRYRGNDELGTDGEENVTVTEFVLHQLLLLLWSQLFSHAPAVYSALPTLLLITACEFPRTVVSYLCYAGWTRFGHNVNFNLHMKQISASAFFFPSVPSQQTCHWPMSLCVVVISYYQVVKMVLWEDFKLTSLHVVLYLNTISTW